jgi:hypothetical protein
LLFGQPLAKLAHSQVARARWHERPPGVGMNRKRLGKWISILGLVCAGIGLLNLSSCARSTKLTGITIQPPSGTFGAVDSTIYFQFKAFGTYIHPPKTVDITNQVSWQSDNPQVIQVTSAGVASPNLNCGVAQIFAEMHNGNSDVVSNSASITVDGPASLGCTPAGPQPILTISFAGNGTGTVTGSGISCSTPSSCSNQFTTGTTLTLTATATGTSTFAGWSGCSSTSGSNASVCTVILENNLTVTATFN